MKRSLCAVAVGTLGLWAAQVHAQGIPVIDSANLVQNTVSSIQNTITSINMVESVAQGVLNLLPLDDVITAKEIAEDLAALGEIMQQAEGLSYDVQSLQSQITSLFDLDSAPSSTSALRVRLAEIRRVRYQCYSYAMKVQTLVTTAARTMDHLIALVNSVANLVGQKQNLQTLNQTALAMHKTQTITATQAAAYQRAGSVDKMEELLTIEALHKINEQMMADWPRRK